MGLGSLGSNIKFLEIGPACVSLRLRDLNAQSRTSIFEEYIRVYSMGQYPHFPVIKSMTGFGLRCQQDTTYRTNVPAGLNVPGELPRAAAAAKP